MHSNENTPYYLTFLSGIILTFLTISISVTIPSSSSNLSSNMTVDADGYNSSDEEFEEAPNPYANVGKASIEAIKDKATEFRKLSKQFVKQLRPTLQAPKSTYNVNLWGNRLETFMSSSLNLPPKTAPTADHLVRFFQFMPDALAGRSKDGKVSLSTMRSSLPAWRHLLV